MQIFKELDFIWIVGNRKFLSKKEAEEYIKKKGKNHVAKKKNQRMA